MQTSDWINGDAPDVLRRVRSAPADALCKVAQTYDWSRCPEAVLGWIMAQKTVDLDTALKAFFNGGPERFNYLHKRDITDEYQGTCRVLDNICLRINSGFYLCRDRVKVTEEARLRNWLAVQATDRREGCSGRWVIDEAIVTPLLNGTPCDVVALDGGDPNPNPCETAPGIMHRLTGLFARRTTG